MSTDGVPNFIAEGAEILEKQGFGYVWLKHIKFGHNWSNITVLDKNRKFQKRSFERK